MLAHWHTAKFVQALTKPMLITMQIQRVVFEEYIKTWNAVYRG